MLKRTGGSFQYTVFTAIPKLNILVIPIDYLCTYGSVVCRFDYMYINVIVLYQCVMCEGPDGPATFRGGRRGAVFAA